MVINLMSEGSHLTYVIQDGEWEHFKQDGGLDREGIHCSLRLLCFHCLVAFVLKLHLVVGYHCIEDNLVIVIVIVIITGLQHLRIPLVSLFQFLIF